MRLALISDLHANEIALDAVLADIDRVGLYAIIETGSLSGERIVVPPMPGTPQ